MVEVTDSTSSPEGPTVHAEQQRLDAMSPHRYEYRNLENRSRKIRLLKLHFDHNNSDRAWQNPDQHERDECAQPCCQNISTATPRFSLQEAFLDDPPEYEAVSYSWGSSDLVQTVLCGSASLAVTQSCWELLQRLKARDSGGTAEFRGKIVPSLYWIDALCIDQKSPEERSSQVTLMEAIYMRAECVVVWPGHLESCKNDNLGWGVWNTIQGSGTGQGKLENPFRSFSPAEQ
jgi:hypothetical protein